MTPVYPSLARSNFPPTAAIKELTPPPTLATEDMFHRVCIAHIKKWQANGNDRRNAFRTVWLAVVTKQVSDRHSYAAARTTYAGDT